MTCSMVEMTHALPPNRPPTPPMAVKGHIRAVLTLGLPLVGGHVAQFAIGMTDSVMLGWYGA